MAIDLNRPMAEMLETLSRHPVATRLSLTGPLIVARDIAHAKLLERLEADGELPDYFKDHPVYYAGPAKTPDGMASGSFGPTTAGRMDGYVSTFHRRRFHGHAGEGQPFAPGPRELPAAWRVLSRQHRRRRGEAGAGIDQEGRGSEYPELGMEAVWKIEVENFPAFIITDDKGNDFFDIG